MADPRTIARLLVPRIPLMLKTAASHTLFALSSSASKLDMRSELIVTMLRSIIGESQSPISRTQNFSLLDPGAKGPMWISKTSFPAPEEDDIRQLLFRVIKDLSETDQETYIEPTLEPVQVEWQGHRAGVSSSAEAPKSLTEAQIYDHLMNDVQSDVTILYFHGGAYYTMDPATHRKPVTRLAKLTGGRGCNVRYRLAPQHPFPAALLDCLVAYLSLLYPPEGALHTAVKPEHIVFAGDSAGGNMCLVLLLFLLQAQQTTVKFGGKHVQLPLPAGIATISPWMDVTRSMPSVSSNQDNDYLPASFTSHPNTPAAELSSLTVPTTNPRQLPACDIWPTSPPRADLYCDSATICHPLVSPLAAPQKLWAGAPPIFFLLGEEQLADEIRVVARTCHRAGVAVTLDAYEAMPHVFTDLLEPTAAAAMARSRIAEWIVQTVGATAEENKSRATWILAKSLKQIPIDDLESLTSLSEEDVKRRMEYGRDVRIQVFERDQARAAAVAAPTKQDPAQAPNGIAKM